MRYKSILFILWPVFLSACTSLPQPALNLKIDAANQLNQDATNQSLPVQVKVYQLTDIALFKEATFRELWKADVSTLDKTLLEKKVLTVNPGETITFKMKRQPQSDYIALMAVFRKHGQENWRVTYQLPGSVASLLKPLYFTLSNNQLEARS
tara:strand:+ start:1482 stop:1937 length:456 start_codon:yes stop_codon:yes gene_type:complete